eukprot:CAMPEP_0118950666 /NCGR_PEP_ID=MMETSP1169-20130426/51796_1 /TAXON_ID=36882 /ORGANISM="Pyramimonas obovata, Strain CCMP722" /LENGTH=194 /DNA_ID=CAMNT_0006897555 /DNA_START=134 /DNA_END=715 /DNA_ORIENTATION=+
MSFASRSHHIGRRSPSETWITSHRFSTRVASTSFVVAKADNAEVEFEVDYQTQFGDSVMLAGNSDELGGWDSSKAVQMTWSEGHKWTARVILPMWQTVEFKCMVRQNNGGEFWQPGDNKRLALPDYNFSGATGVVELKVNMEDWDSNNLNVKVVGETLKQIVEFERAAAREAAAAAATASGASSAVAAAAAAAA